MCVRLPRIFAGLIPLLAIAFAQDKPLDFTTPAVPVSKALAQLSKSAGLALEASGPVGKQIIILRLKGASLKDTMDRIAAVTNGEWQSMQGGYRLVVSDAKVRATRQAEIELSAKAMSKSIAAKARDLAKEPVFDAQIAHAMAIQLQDVQKRMNPNTYDQAAYQQQARLDAKAPAGRALVRILQLLDLVALAQLPMEGRWVLSNVPTRMESALPPGVSGVIESFTKEHQVWAAEAQKVLGDESTEGPVYYGRLTSRAPLKAKPAKCVLVLDRYGIGSGLQVQLMFVDAAGRTVGQASTQVSDQWQGMEEMVNEAAAAATKEEPLKFSDTSEKFMQVFQDSRKSQQGFPVLSDELKKVLLNPEQVDPLSFMPSDGLIQIGERRHENVVAVLPDIAFFSTIFITGAARPTPTAFLQGIKAVQTTVEEKSGWMTVQPKIISGMVVNSDRAATGKLVRTVYSMGRLPLDAAATYAASAGARQEDILTLMLVGLMDPSAVQVLDSNWYCLKFYGLSTPTQRKMWESGQAMELRMLTPLQKDAVEHMVYGVNSRLQLRPNGGPEMNQEWELFNSGIYRFAAESLPNGIPPDGTLTVQFDNRDVIFLGEQPNPNVRYMGNHAIGVEELASQVYMGEHPDIFPWMNDRKISVEKLRVGTQLKLDFEFDFSERLYMPATLQDSAVGAGQAVSLDKLPEALKKRYDAAYEMVKQSYANAKPGQFTSPPTRTGSPPPPS